MTRAHRSLVSYIDKSREYYAAQGYDAPYRWATHSDAPFTPLAKPLSECRIGMVTTAAQDVDAPLEPYVAAIDPPPTALATEHLSWHKDATHTDDLGAYLPIAHLHELATEGTIGSVARRFAGIPTVYSQRRTNKWAELVRDWFAEDDVDLGFFTGPCYVGEPDWDVGRCLSGSPDRIASKLRPLAAMGFNSLQVRLRSRSRTELTDQIAAWGEQVIPLLWEN